MRILATVHAVENHDLLDAINSTYNRTNLVVLDTILIQYLLLPYFPRVNLAGCKLPGYKLTSRYVEIRQKSLSEVSWQISDLCSADSESRSVWTSQLEPTRPTLPPPATAGQTPAWLRLWRQPRSASFPLRAREEYRGEKKMERTVFFELKIIIKFFLKIKFL